MVIGLVSIVIPSRNEPYLSKTIQDALHKATGNIEIIVYLDGYWLDPQDIIDDNRVQYVQTSEARGMRNAINQAVAVSKGEYILKCDAHVMFEKGFDEVLKKDCKDNWIVVPRRFALDPEAWDLEENPKYPVDYMYLSYDLHGRVWDEKNKNADLKEKKIDDLMSSQGSCYFLNKKYYNELELLDEKDYGKFFSEFQEVGLKCWLSGGRVVVNKNTWYAHWHKPKNVGRGYSIDKGQQEIAEKHTKKWFDKAWRKQKHTLDWLVDKFKPVPTW